ncbi:MAG: hypothetical protein KIT84_09440 [Labilithrix sp.]|nr:hypothetical protein [Labilithrix sp.]MCW5811224.1 hypothetical protein [Labilithrix sp.]
MRRLHGSFFMLFLLALAACAPPDDVGTRPLSSRKGNDDRASDEIVEERKEKEEAPSTTEPVVNEPVETAPGGMATTYAGTLDATPTVRFGGQGTGGNFCNYDVTLKNVAIEVTVLPSGQVIAATVRDTMIEASVPPCTYSPAPPSDQTFSFTTMTETSAGESQLAFKGAAGNRPATSLVVDLKKVGGSYEASATWHRTDQPDPLDWTVKTKITLGPR